MSQIQVYRGIACDYVRAEAQGKYSILGIYPYNAISIGDFSLPVSLSFYIEICSTENINVNSTYRIRSKDDNEILHTGNLAFQTKEGLPYPIFTNPINFWFRQPGIAVLEMMIKDEWVEGVIMIVNKMTSQESVSR